MTGSYSRGDAIPVLAPEDEDRLEPVTYTYHQQLNGYEHLKTLDIGYSFSTGPNTEKISEPILARLPQVRGLQEFRTGVSLLNY